MPRHRDAVVRSLPTVAVVATSAWALASVAVVSLEPSVRVTSYAASSPPLLVLGVAAGLGLIAAGALGTVAARRGALGGLALLGAAAWMAPIWVGWEPGPALLRALGMVLATALAPALVHLATVDTRGRIASRWDRRLVGTAYAATFVLSGALMLVYEPIRDRDCWVSCGHDGNPLLLWSNPKLARTLAAGVLVVTVVLGGLALARAAARVVPRRPAWAFGAAVTLPACLALVGEAAYALVLLEDRAERFDSAPGTTAYVMRAAALLLLALGIGWATGWRLHAARRRVGDLVSGMPGGPSPGELESRLATLLRDDSLEIRYYQLPASKQLIDARGRPAAIDSFDRRAVVVVTRAGQPVATVLHDPYRVDGEELSAGLGSLTRLLIDNERLRASALSHLTELQESRARIVATSDDRRREIERDLHDSAQQRLLAAAYELRLALAESGDADPEVVRELERMVVTATNALEELRQFAHGVFPAVLDEAGLEAALFSLSDGAAVPVELDLRGLDGVPAPAARASYVVIRSAVESASERRGVEVRVERQDGDMVVVVTGGGAVDQVRLSDRVGAVGGQLVVHERSVKAVIPCGS